MDPEYEPQPEGPAPRRSLRILGLLGLALATAAAFSSALGNALVHRDDFAHIRMGAYRPLGEIFTKFDYFSYYPLTLLSLGLEHSLVEMEPFLYHLDNVLLHIANSILVVLLIERLLGGRFFVAALAGALFALHPLHVESVAWVAERKDVLSTFFFLLSLLAYLRYGEKSRWSWYGACLALVALSLLSKSMAVTAPIVLWLVDWLRRRPLGAGMVLEKAPFVAMAIGAGYINMLAQSPTVGSGSEHRIELWYDHLGLLGNLGTGVESLAFYLGKLAWPVDLSGHYEVGLIGVEPLQWGIASLTCVAIGVWAWRARAIRREIIWGALFFLVTIAPVIKVIPFGGLSIFNDRYTYFPSVGLFLVVALPFRNAPAWPIGRRAVMLGTCALVVAALGYATFERNQVWKTSETFWSDVISKNGASAYALNKLARYYVDYTTRYDDALALLEEAARHDPKRGESFVNMGVAYEKLGRGDEAEPFYRKGVGVQPENPILRFMAGAYYRRAGRPHDAVEQYQKVIELYPLAAQAHADLGNTYLGMGQSGRARGAYDAALEIDPDQPTANVGLGTIYAEQNQYDKALRFLTKGSRRGAPVDRRLMQRVRARAKPRGGG